MELLDNVHTGAINRVRSSSHSRAACHCGVTSTSPFDMFHYRTTQASSCARIAPWHAEQHLLGGGRPAGGNFTADCDTPYRAIYATPCTGDECIVMPHMRTRSHCGIPADARYCACLVCDDLSLDVCRETPDGDGCRLAPRRETQSTAGTARALCDWGIDSYAPQRRRNTTDIWALGSRYHRVGTRQKSCRLLHTMRWVANDTSSSMLQMPIPRGNVVRMRTAMGCFASFLPKGLDRPPHNYRRH